MIWRYSAAPNAPTAPTLWGWHEYATSTPSAVRSDALELLLIEVGRGERAERDALAAHERITELKLRLLGDRVSRTTAWRLAREHGWARLRDAEYVAIARLQADALLTIDAELAAKAAPVVPVATLATVFGRAAAARSRPRKRVT